MITTEIRNRVTAKIQHGIDLAKRRYNVDIRMPTVVYTKRGTTAGTANYRTWTINLNPVLLVENTDKFIERTVPHELAHLICDLVYPHAHRPTRGVKRDVHGQYWKDIMRTLGVPSNEITRCHSYDVTNAKKKTSSYQYKCEGCGHVFTLGPKRHAKLQSNSRAYRHTACGQGNGQLTLVAAKPAASAPVAVAAKKERAPASTSGSKLDRCYGWYKHYKDAGTANLRQMCIAVFMQEVGMTKAGASTYFQRCKELDS